MGVHAVIARQVVSRAHRSSRHKVPMEGRLMSAAAIVFAAAVPVSVALPKLNGRFCAHAALTDEDRDGSLRKNYFDICIDSADMKTGKVLQVIQGVTYIEDGSYRTTLHADKRCSAQPIGAEGSFFLQEPLNIHPDATLNETKDGKQTWVHVHGTVTCGEVTLGTRYTTIWTVSEKTVDGMQDLLTQSVLVEQCFSEKWHFQQNIGHDLTGNYTRVVDARKFERPPSYCYDAHHWAQSNLCTTRAYDPDPFGGGVTWRTYAGCASEFNFDGCCTTEDGKPHCGIIKNCNSSIYGKAYPDKDAIMV